MHVEPTHKAPPKFQRLLNQYVALAVQENARTIRAAMMLRPTARASNPFATSARGVVSDPFWELGGMPAAPNDAAADT